MNFTSLRRSEIIDDLRAGLEIGVTALVGRCTNHRIEISLRVNDIIRKTGFATLPGASTQIVPAEVAVVPPTRSDFSQSNTSRPSREITAHRPPLSLSLWIDRVAVTRRTHARFTDLIVHFRMDWRRVCRGIDGSCWAVCGGIDGSCSVCAGIGSSRFGALCAINCFGAPLVGARGFLGFRPLLFGMDPTPDHRNAGGGGGFGGLGGSMGQPIHDSWSRAAASCRTRMASARHLAV